MAISVQLQASARSAYRSILRAASSTFAGDEPVRQAFVTKMRKDLVDGKSLVDEVAYAERIHLANEIAEVLKKNFVQGQRVGDGDSWELRLTKDTQLGSNETVKVPLPTKSRKRKQSETNPSDDIKFLHGKSLNYSALKKASQHRVIPVLNENDLEETFIRGSGPGGQAINKLSNNVALLHKPSGIRVQCQETRSLQENRRLARRLIIQKLDQLQNPGLSKEELKWAKEKERKRRKKKKDRKKAGSTLIEAL